MHEGVQIVIVNWHRHYNKRCPHSSIGCLCRRGKPRCMLSAQERMMTLAWRLSAAMTMSAYLSLGL